MYCGRGARIEAPVGPYFVDIDCGDGEIIEIQTRGFAKIRAKLRRLLNTHRVRLVYPLPVEKELVFRHPETGAVLSRRKSPKKNTILELSGEMVGIAGELAHPGLTLEVLMTREEEVRCRDGRGGWRRKGISVIDRVLVAAVDRLRLHSPADYRKAFLPADAPGRFTNRELAAKMEIPLHRARQLTYCLRALGVLGLHSKKANQHVYELTAP